ncbi:hypothetical protein QQX98_006112 [Neonectria punicea]|uniref:Uncharacterized protein n=1 Tax=Neonectria punicea TaxID=979145 RepID=A0ABR1H264_9HYPO
MRNRFLGKDGRPPPLRGIIKEFGEVGGRLRETDVVAMFNNMVDMHQLGIFRLDIGHHQYVNNKLSDLSEAITFPHFATNPEWNPHLTPEQIAAMDYDVFRWTLGDYVSVDCTIQVWNESHKYQKDQIQFRALPDAMMNRKHNLRQTPARGPQRPYVLFDPRGYDWKASDASVGDGATAAMDGRKTGQKRKRSNHGKPHGGIFKNQRVVNAPKWYHDCDIQVIRDLNDGFCPMSWKYEDGHQFPVKRQRKYPFEMLPW